MVLVRAGAWIAFFDRELAEAGGQAVVKEWVPRLALRSAVTHGLIRTRHAVRCLSAGETRHRIHELAEGLGYWAARDWRLPGRPSGHDFGHAPREAMQRIGRVHGSDCEAVGSMSQSLRGLHQQPTCAQAIALVDTAGDLSRFISELARLARASTSRTSRASSLLCTR